MKKTIVIIALISLIVLVYYRQTRKDYYDYLTISGATPLAVAEKVPLDLSLTIDGMVKKKYLFSGSALNALATTRIRTREFSPRGNFSGAYIYLGIPVFNILEGIAPEKPAGSPFDSPLDILVTFSSASGKKVRFSYNEIIMADDRHPVTLAFNRKQVLPTNEKARERYQANLFTNDIKGFRLICPREPDTARYLDEVVKITYSVPQVPDSLLPVRKKGNRCKGKIITCIQSMTPRPATFQNVQHIVVKNWLRIGHGHGYDDISRADGYDLKSFLASNFPSCKPKDFFLFVACDGYRCLFSGREIFKTGDGDKMLIIKSLNGKSPPEGYMLGPTADFFSDRAMWGLSYVVKVNPGS